ncbi:hypothetical protein [Archangium sp.]|uniref:hypothetical protein n=1 Tax=Archangium sp. TaxID=1872627 RepID=UPI002D70A90C|nr:hypothetical protein [Archangium sp.]HYO55897.1 hypothetical protein [Archangium sp.]
MFLLDNSESRLDFPEYLPEVFTPGFDPPPAVPKPGERGYDSDYGHWINTGCTDPALVAAMSWFDKGSPDPAKNGSVSYDNDADFGTTPFFEPDKFYHARGRRIAWAVEDFPWSLSAATSSLDASSYIQGRCYQVTNWDSSPNWYNSPVMKECEQCLATKGWWRGPLITAKTSSWFNDDDFPPTRKLSITGQEPPPPEAYRKWIVSGRVLNVRPPKFVVARKVLKEIINMAPNVRMGVATFGKDHGWFDPPELLSELRPSCDLSFPTINEAALDRPLLMKAVNSTQFRNYERSTGEALFGLGGYFSSQKQDNKWKNWFDQPLSPGYFGWPGCCNGGTYDNADTGQEGIYYGVTADEWLKAPKWGTDPLTGNPWYLPGQPFENGDSNRRSVCFSDQTSAVIVLTDGAPRYDNTVPITRMMEILKAHGAQHPDGALLTFDPSNPETNANPGGVNYCHLFGATQQDCDYTAYNWPTGLARTNKNFMDDVAFFLSRTDLRGDMTGSQTMRTFVVGYGDSSPMLQSIALAGQGRFYRADNPVALRDALMRTLGEIRAPASSAP